jgi:hypothetical protein
VTDPGRFVIWPHHPDVLRRPVTNGLHACATQALTWNIFRTAELLPPAFWLRRLNAALGVPLPCPAPATGRVQLWVQPPVPPGRGLSARDAVDIDVVIETEHAVWALLVCDRDVAASPAAGGIDRVAMTAYAASWYAGRRQCYVGLVASAPERAPLGISLVRKYQLSPAALHVRWPDRHHDAGNLLGFGFTSWSRLMDIVGEASRSDTLGVAERTIARQTFEWGQSLAPAAPSHHQISVPSVRRRPAAG